MQRRAQRIGAVFCLAMANALAIAAPSPSSETPAPAPATASPSEPGSADSLPLRRDASPIWQTGGTDPFAALTIVLLIAGGGGWFLWRRKARNGDGGKRPGWPFRGPPQATLSLKVLQSIRLTPRASLHIVKWNDRSLLLGCTDQGVTVLSHGDAAHLPEPGAPASRAEAP